MKTWKDICNVLASLNSPKKVDDFLYDLTSEKEREEFARRFEVAQLLDQGISYKEIESKTGMSSTTIARIAKFLNGEKGGYKNALTFLKKE